MFPKWDRWDELSVSRPRCNGVAFILLSIFFASFIFVVCIDPYEGATTCTFTPRSLREEREEAGEGLSWMRCDFFLLFVERAWDMG